MKVDGGCLCGHVTYEAVVDPNWVVVCHCSDCQTHSGAAYGVVVAADENEFKLLTGTLKTYEKTADSGTIRAVNFCPECGTRIHATTVGEGTAFMGLRAGTVLQRDQLKPRIQVWCRSAQDWTRDLSNLPQFETQPTMDELKAMAKR